MTSESLLSELSCPVIPVVVIEDIEHAVPLAEALFSGGISALDITLRTGLGLDAISRIKAEFPERPVGAGTVCSPEQFDAAVRAGADFIVTGTLAEETSGVEELQQALGPIVETCS